MTRHALLLVVAVFALAARRDPCGTDTTQVGVNGACTRTKDCDDGLSCVGGVCSLPEAAPPDAGMEASDSDVADGHPAD